MHRIDPVCLPQTVGIVDCLLQNPFESVDGGVIEEDGDIHSPLYASRAHLATINTSSEIRIRGGAPLRYRQGCSCTFAIRSSRSSCGSYPPV